MSSGHSRERTHTGAPERAGGDPQGLTRPEKSLQLKVNNPKIGLHFTVCPKIGLHCNEDLNGNDQCSRANR